MDKNSSDLIQEASGALLFEFVVLFVCLFCFVLFCFLRHQIFNSS